MRESRGPETSRGLSGFIYRILKLEIENNQQINVDHIIKLTEIMNKDSFKVKYPTSEALNKIITTTFQTMSHYVDFLKKLTNYYMTARISKTTLSVVSTPP